MDVNKIKILFTGQTNMNLTVPISENWDFLNRGDTIDAYEEEVLNQVIKEPVDFEVVRFGKIARNGITSILYQFNFFDFLTNTYENSYVVPNRLNAYQIFYNKKPFTKSFFKLDFYDSNSKVNQKLYLSIILPTRLKQPTEVKQYKGKDYTVKKPSFTLDYMGEREGYFIYFFENFNVVEIDTFYVSAKFFSGLDGTYTQFTNVPQNELINFSEVDESYFYYKYKLLYDKKEYTVFAPNSTIEVPISSIFWYEFIS